MKFDPQKHHRRSIRLPGYDYSQSGAYFVTICTRNASDEKGIGVALAATPDLDNEFHNNDFTSTPTTAFELTEIGRIVEHNWLDLNNRFSTIDLDEYIIMPNHFHGIVIIDKQNQLSTKDERQRVAARATPTLGTIIGAFKSKSIHIHDILEYISEKQLNIIGKIWQKNYYEEIIRNEKELGRVREYIRNNPKNWAEDEENPTANKSMHRSLRPRHR